MTGTYEEYSLIEDLKGELKYHVGQPLRINFLNQIYFTKIYAIIPLQEGIKYIISHPALSNIDNTHHNLPPNINFVALSLSSLEHAATILHYQQK